MKKLFSTKAMVIALPVVIVVIIIAIIIRLTLWDRGFFTHEPDWSAIEADIGAESSDFYIMRNPAEVNNPDGITTIVLLGDDTFAGERGKSGVAAYLTEYTGATVYNCAFEGALGASYFPSFNVEYGNDSFSLYRIAAATAADDFILQKAYLDVTSMRKDYFEDTINLLEDINFKNVDVFVLNFGINDYLADFPVVNSEDGMDIATYLGSMRRALDLIQSHYPEATIVVSGPHYVDYLADDGTYLPGDRTKNGAGYLLSTFMRSTLEECQGRSITFLDNYFGMDYVRTEPDTYLEDDHKTLTEEGRKKLAERIAYAIVYRLGYEFKN